MHWDSCPSGLATQRQGTRHARHHDAARSCLSSALPVTPPRKEISEQGRHMKFSDEILKCQEHRKCYGCCSAQHARGAAVLLPPGAAACCCCPPAAWCSLPHPCRAPHHGSSLHLRTGPARRPQTGGSRCTSRSLCSAASLGTRAAWPPPHWQHRRSGPRPAGPPTTPADRLSGCG